MSKSKLRQRRFGELEALLADALEAQRIGKGAIRRLKGIDAAIHERFSNPDNWIEAGVVLMIHVDERTGQQTTIGCFQELKHKFSAARKLLRVTADTSVASPTSAKGVLRTEVSRDPFLLNGYQSPCPPAAPANEYEKRAIRDYLARTKNQSLAEFLGDPLEAQRLLNELKQMGVEL